MQALDVQEMHWAQVLDIGARELHTPWMADHRRKSRLDLTSWR